MPHLFINVKQNFKSMALFNNKTKLLTQAGETKVEFVCVAFIIQLLKKRPNLS